MRPKWKNFTYKQGNDKQHEAHFTWYRGDHCNFNPSKQNLQEENAPDKYVIAGWEPERPFITRSHFITAFGSCFAQHISEYLEKRGYSIGSSNQYLGNSHMDSHVIRFGEGMVNTYAIRQQFEWAFEAVGVHENIWHDDQGNAVSRDGSVRNATWEIFRQTDIFIITLGLSEVWFNKKTNEVFWRAIPHEQFNPDIHGFKITSIAENIDNLERIYQLIRMHRKKATIIFTVSPIPLVATFRPISCITANSVSKSILRVAVDEVSRLHKDDKKLFYWPSYELVKDFFKNPYTDDNRHVCEPVLDQIMSLFSKFYLVDF